MILAVDGHEIFQTLQLKHVFNILEKKISSKSRNFPSILESYSSMDIIHLKFIGAN